MINEVVVYQNLRQYRQIRGQSVRIDRNSLCSSIYIYIDLPSHMEYTTRIICIKVLKRYLIDKTRKTYLTIFEK
jgi:hypothetical protein